MTSTSALPTEAPLAEWMGQTLVSKGGGEAVLQLIQRVAFNNCRGVTHGGVLARLRNSVVARNVRTM